MRVCLAPFGMFQYHNLGGQAWVYINWALGFQANDCEITILDTVASWADHETILRQIKTFIADLEHLGLMARLALYLSPKQREALKPIEPELSKLTVSLEQASEDCDVLINFRYGLPDKIVRRFRRTALIDIDPGLLQIWISEGQLRVADHDIYFSTGETVGTPSAIFPDCGIDWHYAPPVVYLPVWPIQANVSAAPYTTISSWWSNYEKFRGDVFNNEKRTSFLEYVELPSHTNVELELTLFLANNATDRRERAFLESKGWRVHRSQEIVAHPRAYRNYIQSSRGEFSCAKPSCMRLENAWVSDRTLCYLASGKPAVVQYTGPSSILPDAEGLFRFRSFEEASCAFTRIERDYMFHSRMARSLVQEYFDARIIAGQVLEKALSISSYRDKVRTNK